MFFAGPLYKIDNKHSYNEFEKQVGLHHQLTGISCFFLSGGFTEGPGRSSL